MSANKNTTEFVQQVLALDAPTLQTWLANQTPEGRRNVLAHLEAYRTGLEVKRWQLQGRGRELAARRANAQTTLERLEALHQGIIADLGEQFGHIYQNPQAAVQAAWKIAHEESPQAVQTLLSRSPQKLGDLLGSLPFLPARADALRTAKNLDFARLWDLYYHTETLKTELAQKLKEIPHVRH